MSVSQSQEGEDSLEIHSITELWTAIKSKCDEYDAKVQQLQQQRNEDIKDLEFKYFSFLQQQQQQNFENEQKHYGFDTMAFPMHDTNNIGIENNNNNNNNNNNSNSNSGARITNDPPNDMLLMGHDLRGNNNSRLRIRSNSHGNNALSMNMSFISDGSQTTMTAFTTTSGSKRRKPIVYCSNNHKMKLSYNVSTFASKICSKCGNKGERFSKWLLCMKCSSDISYCLGCGYQVEGENEI